MFSPEPAEADILQGPCLGTLSFHLYSCSYDNENYIYLADFPKELSIKYLVNSFHGDIAVVTETEEVGCPAPLPTSSLPIPNSGGLPSAPVRVRKPNRRKPSGTVEKGSRSCIYS